MLQRVSALYLVLFFAWLGARLLTAPPESYAAWRAWLATPVVNGAWAVFFAALLVHGWVGVRDILMDYVRSTGWRLLLLTLLALVLLAIGYRALMLLVSVGAP